MNRRTISIMQSRKAEKYVSVYLIPFCSTIFYEFLLRFSWGREVDIGTLKYRGKIKSIHEEFR
jgi:hypothetical protein